MNTGSRLGVHVLAWAASIPALNVLLTALERHGVLPVSGDIVAAVAMALLLWAVLIYRHRVPHAVRAFERGLWLLAFTVAMLLVGATALFAAFWVTVAIYGL
ncbi:hypothetical protein SAMN05216567_12262 [Variovorax sp. OK605]|jgi:hypothetical protein|uniref:hypothetical protein n=1 Tax=Variovorax sp. OK605 TaxID=1855317 RepID=UPI0008F025CC|nr:hypothetical protein [Variovorax sp. OK605]SFQ62169.1 hypothetical protein SAMN05216567_12262 [Variovorax sp. OK605]